MSDLSCIERLKLEKILEMDGGYVLDFTNKTFQDFIIENAGVDIYESKYECSSGSKANRLRKFLTQEPNHITGKLISDLLDYWKTRNIINSREIGQAEQALLEECFKIAERLKRGSIIENVDVIQPYYNDKNFSLLAKSLRENIQNNEPEVALDRLHTFLVRYTRELCNKHKITYDKNKPLHSLFGEYIKYLKQKDFIESEMTERILKSSISILESFNDVRNNKSFAHDNPILNYNESLLIFNNVSSAIRFIEAVEKENMEKNEQNDVQTEWEDFSF